MLLRAAALVLALLIGVAPIIAQRGTAMAFGGGFATVYGGHGVSGALRIESPVARIGWNTDLVASGGFWVALTGVAGVSELHRTSWGVGPQLGVAWYPGGSAWRMYAGAGIDLLRSVTEHPTVPMERAPVPTTLLSTSSAARTTGPGAALALRVSAPNGERTSFEVGAIATRHGSFDQGAAWWTRVEAGFRFGIGPSRR